MPVGKIYRISHWASGGGPPIRLSEQADRWSGKAGHPKRARRRRTKQSTRRSRRQRNEFEDIIAFGKRPDEINHVRVRGSERKRQEMRLLNVPHGHLGPGASGRRSSNREGSPRYLGGATLMLRTFSVDRVRRRSPFGSKGPRAKVVATPDRGELHDARLGRVVGIKSGKKNTGSIKGERIRKPVVCGESCSSSVWRNLQNRRPPAHKKIAANPESQPGNGRTRTGERDKCRRCSRQGQT